VFESIVEASEHMAHLRDTTYVPRTDHLAAYDAIYCEYLRLHDLLGGGGDEVMRNLLRIRDESVVAAFTRLRS
jgi:L-ribulokinase